MSLPEGWVETTLGEVLPNYAKNKKINSNELLDDTWVLELEDIEKHSSKLLKKVMYSERQSKSTKNIFYKGDVLYGKLRPYLNKVIIADNDGVCTTEIIPIRGNKKVINKYIFYVLKSSAFLKYVDFSTHGLNMPRLGTASAKKAPFPLAPLKEQKQIAQKLDQVLARVERIKMALDDTPATIKRFRQSVLALAVSGGFSKENNWRDHLIKNFTTKVGSGSTPKGGRSAYKEKGIPLIRSMNVHFNGIKYKNLAYIDEIQAEKLKNVILEKNDVLLNITGASIGRVNIITDNNLVGGRVNQHVSIIRVDKDIILAQYLCFYLASPITQEWIQSENFGGTREALTKTMILNYKIPLPTLKEQKAIVKKIETLFTLADNLEAKITQAQKQVDRLTQSILAKAFRGEL